MRSPKEHLATILTAPFMVCGAKFTIFLMLAGVFFPGNEAKVLLILTVVAWLVALLVSKVLRSTLIRGAPTPFIMELPPYRLPTLYGVVTHTWDRVWQFVKKAGTVIFAISIIMWVLMTFPSLPKEQVEHFEVQRKTAIVETKLMTKDDELMLTDKLNKIDNTEQEASLKHSYGGRMGMWMESVSKYAGFSWQANIALIGGFTAKEVILSTLSTAYSLGSAAGEEDEALGSESGLGKKLLESSDWPIPAVISFFLFVLLYSPCLVTVVVMAKESSWGWALFGTFGSLIFTYVLCVIVYQMLSVWMC